MRDMVLTAQQHKHAFVHIAGNLIMWFLRVFEELR